MSARPSPFLTTDEIAALFRVDRGTVTRWTRRGWLHSCSPGQHKRFRAIDVANLYRKLNGRLP